MTTNVIRAALFGMAKLCPSVDAIVKKTGVVISRVYFNANEKILTMNMVPKNSESSTAGCLVFRAIPEKKLCMEVFGSLSNAKEANTIIPRNIKLDADVLTEINKALEQQADKLDAEYLRFTEVMNAQGYAIDSQSPEEIDLQQTTSVLNFRTIGM